MNYISIAITGRVQGVFFRASTQQVARELSLVGFVTNRADGSVYLEAGGHQKDLNKLISWCHHGPSSAQVNQVKATPISTFSRPDHDHDFLII